MPTNEYAADLRTSDLSRHAKQGGDVRDVLRQYKGKNIPALYRQRRAGGTAQGQQAAKKSGWF
jgi:hypothetical protein